MLTSYDKWEKYHGETPVAMTISEDTKKVFNCSSCSYNHNDVSFLVDPYDGKYFVCQMTKKKVFYK